MWIPLLPFFNFLFCLKQNNILKIIKISMNKVFLLLFILWVFLFCVILRHRYKTLQRSKDIEQNYQKAFQHEPDEICKYKLNLLEDNERTSFLSKYKKIIQQSKKEARKENILFIGLIRNKGDQALSFWPPIIDRLGKYCKEYQVIFVENDSSDGTREKLVSFCKKNKNYRVFCPKDKKWNTDSCEMGMVSIQSRKDKFNKIEHRLNVLTQLREISLEQIKTFENFDFIVLLDWDLQGDFSTEGFFHALSVLRENKEFDMVTSNSFYKQFGFYFINDTFPLLFPKNGICEKKQTININKLPKLVEYINTFLSSVEPVPIKSGFGGMSIYKMSSLKEKDPHYDIPERCPYTCEHSNFNENLNVVLDPWFTFHVKKNLH
jgi:hypothetical protein